MKNSANNNEENLISFKRKQFLFGVILFLIVWVVTITVSIFQLYNDKQEYNSKISNLENNNKVLSGKMTEMNKENSNFYRDYLRTRAIDLIESGAKEEEGLINNENFTIKYGYLFRSDRKHAIIAKKSKLQDDYELHSGISFLSVYQYWGGIWEEQYFNYEVGIYYGLSNIETCDVDNDGIKDIVIDTGGGGNGGKLYEAWLSNDHHNNFEYFPIEVMKKGEFYCTE